MDRGLLSALRIRWREARAQYGILGAFRRLAAEAAEFLRDSTPARKRSRYGDLDFDWEHQVNTSAGPVGHRTRFAAVLGGSPYQPSEPALFHEMLDALALDWPQFTFIDIGSGKGRALLLAADYPFHRIVGVEIVPELHQAAVDNIRCYRGPRQQCFALESVCGDAREFEIPAEPLLLHLFNPLPEPALQGFLARVEKSLAQHPRPVYVLYQNTLLEHTLANRPAWQKVGGTHQYAVYRNS